MATEIPCNYAKTSAAYLAASAWIDAGADLVCQRVLAMHRETIEPRRPVDEGGDGTLRTCIVARKRADVVRCAARQGWTPDSEAVAVLEATHPPDKHRRAPCPAADAIRAAAGKGTYAYLVGKGPSLDSLTAADFPDASAPILAINEAVLAIERLSLPNPVFGVQQDARLRQAARPKTSTWLLSHQAWGACRGQDYPGAIKYDSNAIGGSTKSLTANQSLRMLGIAGIRTVRMLAFDACTSGCTDYAPSVGHRSDQFKQRPERFRGYCPEIGRVATREGITLSWQWPRQGWSVVCVLRSGGRYGPEHAEWLRRQCAARIKTPYTWRVLTDLAGITGGVPLAHDWPGWWSKVEAFRPGLIDGAALYLDLDTVLTRDFALPDIESIEPGMLYAQADWLRAGEINSSVMIWRGDSCLPVYEAMLADPPAVIQLHRVHGDQAHTSAVMAGKTAQIPLVVASHKLSKAAPAAVDVMVFHGAPKPWQVAAPWIPSLPSPKSRADGLSQLCREIEARVVVEVGLKEGKTSAAMLKALPQIRHYGVDLFQAQPAATDGETYAAWNWDGIIRDYRKNLEPYRDRAVTIIGDQCAAARMIPERVCLAFLDADHRTEPTRAAIRAWYPKIRDGGILAGHDYDWLSVREAVAKELGGHDIYTLPDNIWYVYRRPPRVESSGEALS